MAFPWAATIGGAASFLGGASANRARAREAQLNRSFQERMSSTARRRDVIDLKAAGLNPILAAMTSGSSTPSGSMANQQDVVTPAIASATSLRRANQEIKNLKATETKIAAETRRINAQIPPIELIGDSVTSARALGRGLKPAAIKKLTDLFEYLGDLPSPDLDAYRNSAKDVQMIYRRKKGKKTITHKPQRSPLKIDVYGKRKR